MSWTAGLQVPAVGCMAAMSASISGTGFGHASGRFRRSSARRPAPWVYLRSAWVVENEAGFQKQYSRALFPRLLWGRTKFDASIWPI